MKVKIKRKCFRCGYSWESRKKEIMVCARCRSPYWHKPKKERNLTLEERMEKLKQGL